MLWQSAPESVLITHCTAMTAKAQRSSPGSPPTKNLNTRMIPAKIMVISTLFGCIE